MGVIVESGPFCWKYMAPITAELVDAHREDCVSRYNGCAHCPYVGQAGVKIPGFTSFQAAKEWLEAQGFEYLGSCTILDCSTYFFVKRRQGAPPLLARVDGWWGDWAPRVVATDERGVKEIRQRIAEEAKRR